MNFTSPIEKRGGFHPRILPQEIEDFLDSLKFQKRIRNMKVGASIKVPMLLTPMQARAFQERIWRLNESIDKEYRTFKSKKTGFMFIFRIA